MNVDDELKYSYSSKPRAVQTNRAKVGRDGADRSQGKPAPPNIMHDPRIMRGSVFAAHALTSPRGSNNNEKPKKRRSQGGPKKSKSIYEAQRGISSAFSPLSLEANLIEQTSSVVEKEGFSQTDEFVRYVTPKKKIATADGKFHRPKVGVDSGTQIEESDKLFNFDVEVKPLLNVLVSKTLTQALAEVKEELEMKNVVRERKVLVGHKADAERTDRELEEQAKEALRQKEAKKREQDLKQQRIKVMKEKVLAWQLAHRIARQAIAQATTTLEAKGVFYNPLHRELAQWLATEVYHGSDAKLRLRTVAASLLDDLVFNALRRQSILMQLLPHEHEALVRISLKDPIQVPIVNEEDGTTSTTDVSVLGPISLSRHDSLGLIERKLQEWITANVGADVAVPEGGFLSLLRVAESI